MKIKVSRNLLTTKINSILFHTYLKDIFYTPKTHQKFCYNLEFYRLTHVEY